MESKREKIFETKDGSFINYITYEDCLAYQEYLNKLCVKEKSENYGFDTDEGQKKKRKIDAEHEQETEEEATLNEKSPHNKHDKLFKDLFSNKDEVSKFINEYLKLPIPILAENLEKYSTSYITKAYENKEADIVYKLKDKNIFFLIEHQSTVDRTMPYRIANYSLAIMNSALSKDKMRSKDYKYPRVVPIVLYTGKKKWDVPVNLEDIQENLTGYNVAVQAYNLIDANQCNDEKLLKDDMLISKAILVEKGNSKEEIVSNFKAIIENLKSLKISQSDHLISVIQNYLLEGILDSEDKSEIAKIIEKSGGEENMLNCVKVINAENARLVRQGRKEGSKERTITIVKKLYKIDMPIRQIAEVAELDVTEVKRILEIKD